ncbi:MAG: transporter related [Acidobacteriales bacterium]|nr:transporter related [Terriglobales bacterium]
MIELEDLSVQLGKRLILSNLKASLKGRAIGLLGPNGSGKSTLINTLLGFHPPLSGTARIFGKDIRTHAKELRRVIGYMPESDSFISDMTGVGFVRYMAEISGLPANEAMERTHEAFFYVGLGEARYRKLGTYSLGMKQMAKLAQAIVHGPQLLFLDEPTNGLDPPARQRMINLIREIRDTPGMYLILSSHLLRDVEECCEEALILRDGKIAAYCNLDEERRSNRKFIEMETVGAKEEFSSAIEQLGCECAWFSNGRAKLVLPPSVEMRQLYNTAAQFSVQIRKINYRKDSLEDIFLRAMDGKFQPEKMKAQSNVS